GGGKITAVNGLTSNMNMTLTGSNGNIKFSAAGQTIQLGGNLTGRGGLEVSAGTLLLKGAANAYDGQTVVDTGATLTLDSTAALTLSLSALETDGNRFAFDGDGYLTLNGTVNLDFTGATGTEWKLINTSLIATMNDNWLAGFTKDSGDDIWTKDGGYTFRLDTGILTIPEPSAWTLLLTGAALLAVLRRRR
ncbi:MAG: PEP-CTERM sorting domain-containing protein, partial [Verrucomicrobiales bacterium]|nr:PEP-CTERM sorting domain-containing protein [Verrucomicrobiales bacterium]